VSGHAGDLDDVAVLIEVLRRPVESALTPAV